MRWRRASRTNTCSFCGSEADRTNYLVASEKAMICGSCVLVSLSSILKGRELQPKDLQRMADLLAKAKEAAGPQTDDAKEHYLVLADAIVADAKTAMTHLQNQGKNDV